MSLYFYLPLIELSSDFCNNFVPGILRVEALFEEICCKQNQIYFFKEGVVVLAEMVKLGKP
jgi:hypothetical protein